MKKLISLLICICILSSAFIVSANDVYIELDSLQYDEYMRGETIFISGRTNAYVSLGLYYPESYGSSAKYIMVYSPTELKDGISLEMGTEERLWPDGVWTITVQSGDVSETLEFTLSETVDRTEEPTEKPTSKPNTGAVATVIPITLDKTSLTLTAGEKATVSITTTASNLSLEIEDDSVVSASLSGKTLTVNALKRGESTIWIKLTNNYASLKITVKAKPTTDSSGPDYEKPTEPPTEAPTDAPTEPPTEEPTVAPTENPFTDIESHWAKESIIALYKQGIVNGMDSDSFAPDDSVTRAQFVTMLYKAFGLKAQSGSSPFNDVTEDDWFFTAVMSAYENGITKGDIAGNFNPNSLITRQDMAVLAHRAALSNGKIFNVTSITTFSDHASISDYAVEAVYSMRSEGIINGMTDFVFEPNGTATRAQAAHIIAKLLDIK